MAHWGYKGEAGPDNWYKEYPIANEGKRQSPIDIKTSDVQYDPSLEKLKFDYDPKSIKDVTNNGHTFTVAVNKSDLNDITSGPLKYKYELAQFHCHWGSKDQQGSEHTVDGKSYDAELHFVHWNTDKFKTVGEALGGEDGIAVVGTFIKVGKAHPYWEKLLPFLDKVVHKEESADVNIEGGFHAANILPHNTSDYYTYLGSLTTPPLYESVTWIIFKEPVEMSAEQMAKFRALMSTKAGEAHEACMADNYRPTMPLHGRVVKSNFK